MKKFVKVIHGPYNAKDADCPVCNINLVRGKLDTVGNFHSTRTLVRGETVYCFKCLSCNEIYYDEVE